MISLPISDRRSDLLACNLLVLLMPGGIGKGTIKARHSPRPRQRTQLTGGIAVYPSIGEREGKIEIGDED